MAAEKLDIQVIEASGLNVGGIKEVFFVSHAGAERYRSDTRPVRGQAAQFQETVSFVVPDELDEVVIQLWADLGYDVKLLGEGDLDPEEDIGNNQQVELVNQDDDEIGVLRVNVKGSFGTYEELGVTLPQNQPSGTRSIGGKDGLDYCSNYDPDGNGVDQSDLSRGLFGNKQQQYEKPPPVRGYQGPRQAPGQARSTTSNVIMGVGGAAVIIGLGYLWYKRHKKRKQQKKERKERKKMRKEQKKRARAERKQRKNNPYYTPPTVVNSSYQSSYTTSQANAPLGYPAQSKQPPATPSEPYTGPPGMYQTPPKCDLQRASFNRVYQQQQMNQQSQSSLSHANSFTSGYAQRESFQQPSPNLGVSPMGAQGGSRAVNRFQLQLGRPPVQPVQGTEVGNSDAPSFFSNTFQQNNTRGFNQYPSSNQGQGFFNMPNM